MYISVYIYITIYIYVCVFNRYLIILYIVVPCLSAISSSLSSALPYFPAFELSPN